MGIYYYAVDSQDKSFFAPPGSFNNKTPGLYAKGNPFPSMVIMRNSRGYNYEIVNDMGSFYEEFCTWKDVTEEVYKELLNTLPQWKHET